MKSILTRNEALRSMRDSVSKPETVNHMLAAEAVMRALARRFGEDEEEWGLAGLLHDIDVEIIESEPNAHGKLGADLACDLGASKAVCRAIMCHNEQLGLRCENRMEKALFCADPITGLITASALVRPDKKLTGLTAASVLKRFNEKRFAAAVKREQISACADLGLELKDFVALALDAMKGISNHLEL